MRLFVSKLPPVRRPAAGFTLVEVMTAATLLLVGFVGLLGAVTLSANAMDHARRETLATQILALEIDKIRLTTKPPPIGNWTPTTWAEINALSAANTPLTIDSQFDDAKDPNPANVANWSRYYGADFTLTRNFTNPNPDTNLREVNFIVTWTVRTSRTSGGQPVTFTFSRQHSTYLGKYGLYQSYQRS